MQITSFRIKGLSPAGKNKPTNPTTNQRMLMKQGEEWEVESENEKKKEKRA